MRRSVVVLILASAMAAHAGDKPRVPTTPLSAEKYPQHDSHPLEKVTIAAEPGDTQDTRPKTRMEYFDHDLLPIRVIVTNNSDRALTLDDARIHFIAADNSNLPAASTDDIQRRLFTVKSATGTKHEIPLGPISIPVTTGKQKVDAKVLADDKDFGFKTTTVAPHSTVAGYLFYDVSDVDRPVLSHATLELRKVRWADRNADGSSNVLESFEIPLQPFRDNGEAKQQ